MTGPRILTILDRDLGISHRGNVQRIFSILAAFKQLACTTAIACSAAATLERVAPLCDELFLLKGPRYQGGAVSSFNSEVYSTQIEGICGYWRPDVAIAQYAWMAPCLKSVPEGCLRVVDTHDVLHQRDETFRRAGMESWVQCDAQTERRLLRHADIVLAIHQADANTFRRLVDQRVICVPHGVQLDPAHPIVPSSGHNVAFVGSAHLGNSGIKEFIRSSWPKIQGQVAQSRLKIYGGICNWLGEAIGCHLMGNVDDIGLAYRDSALVICPVTAGSGLKIKLVEAFRHGRTAVTTPSGIEGCAGSVENVSCVAELGGEFEHAVVDLLVNSERRRRMESAAFAYAQQYYSIDALATSLAPLLGRERTGPDAADLSPG